MSAPTVDPVIEDKPAQSDNSVHHRACLFCNGINPALYYAGLQKFGELALTLCGLKMKPGGAGLPACPLCVEYLSQCKSHGACIRCGVKL